MQSHILKREHFAQASGFLPLFYYGPQLSSVCPPPAEVLKSSLGRPVFLLSKRDSFSLACIRSADRYTEHSVCTKEAEDDPLSTLGEDLALIVVKRCSIIQVSSPFET